MMASRKIVKVKKGDGKIGSKKLVSKLTMKERKSSKKGPQKKPSLKKTQPKKEEKMPMKKIAKAMKSIKGTSGDDAQAEDAVMKIMPESKKVKKQSHELGRLPGVQETKNQVKENEKIRVRFLNGNEACSFNRGVTTAGIRVTVANQLNMFAPQVKIYGFSTGDLISPDMQPDAIPLIILVVVDPSLIFDDHAWKEAIELHGEAADINGVRRVIAAIDAASNGEGVIGGSALLTEVFYEKIGPEMNTCLETLLEVGVVDVHQNDDDGDSSLMAACDCGNLELVNRLLAAGADVHHRNAYGWTSLITASYRAHHQIVESLLAAGSNVNEEDDEGHTSLMFVCRYGPVSIVERLLAAGADVRRWNMSGWTALDFARIHSPDRVIARLLRAGA